jgi:hypothetical protein
MTTVSKMLFLACLLPAAVFAQMRTDINPTVPGSSSSATFLDYRTNMSTPFYDRIGITHARPRYLPWYSGTDYSGMNILKVGAGHATGLGYRNFKLWATQEVFDPNFYGTTFTGAPTPAELIANSFYTSTFADLESRGVTNVYIEYAPWKYDGNGNLVGMNFSINNSTDFNNTKSEFIDSGLVESASYAFATQLLATNRSLNFVIQNHEVESHALNPANGQPYAYSFQIYKLYFEAVQKGVNAARNAYGQSWAKVEHMCEFTGAPIESTPSPTENTNYSSGANYILSKMSVRCDRVGFSAWNYMNQVAYAAERLAFVANGAIPANIRLEAGESWYTKDHRMVLQGDGNLVVYRNDNYAVTFYSNSANQDCSQANNCFALFQGDGNFVLYNRGVPYWYTSTSGRNGMDYEFIAARANGIPAIRRKSDGAIVWPTTAHYGTYPNYYGFPYRDISATYSGNNIAFNTKLDISEIGVQENNTNFNWLMIPGHVEYQIYLVTLSPYVDRYLSWILYDNECANPMINTGVTGCGGYGFYTSSGGYSAMANIYKPNLDQSLRARSSALLTASFTSLVRTWGPYPANDSNAALYESTLADALVAEYNANGSLSVFDMEARIRNALVVTSGVMSKDSWRTAVGNLYLEILHRAADTGGLYFNTSMILASANPSSKYNDIRTYFQNYCNSSPTACANGQL